MIGQLVLKERKEELNLEEKNMLDLLLK